MFARFRETAGTLLSREVAVLTNAIAFNFLLCLFPLVLVVAAVAQQLPQGGRASAALLFLLNELIPFQHEALAESLRRLARTARGLEAFSLLLIVWGSSGIFMPMEMVLNRVWGGTSHRTFWKSRGLAFLMTLAGGLLVLLSVTLTQVARSYSRSWPRATSLGVKLAAFALTTLLFFLVYWVVPALRVRVGVAFRAALWAGVSWELIKYGFIIKLGQMNLAAFYGPLAFAVSLVLWAYVSSLTMVFGALMVARRLNDDGQKNR